MTEFLTAPYILLFVIILLAKTVEAVTGFGSTIIALTIGAQLFPMTVLLPVLVPLNLALSAYIVARHYRTIDIREFGFRILPYSGAGLIVGIIVFSRIQGHALKIAYGVFVLLFSIYELAKLIRGVQSTRQLSLPAAIAWLFTGGVIQGIYASGGPMVVTYVGRKLTDKSVFRSTLSLLWLVLNAVLLVTYILDGKLTPHTLLVCAFTFPAIIGGILLGEAVHGRIPERTFRIVVYAILIIAGASLILKA